MKKVFLIYSELLTILAGMIIGLIINMEAILGLLRRFSWRWVIPHSWGSTVAVIILLASILLLLWNIYGKTKKEEFPKKNDANSPKKEDVEKKEAAGKKEKPKSDAFGSVWSFSKLMLGFSVFAGLLCWVLFVAYKNFVFNGNNVSRSRQTQTATDSFGEIPAEIALPIICGCESSGTPGVIKHFEDDGVTPLKNKPKPGAEPSSAIGGCQILASLHEKRAKDEFKLDIRTPEGNLAYAKVLYNESTPHTKHWEGTPGNTTKGCWAPKLAALGYDSSGGEGFYKTAKTFVVEAPISNWGTTTQTPFSPLKWDIDGGGKKYTVLWNGKVEENLPRSPEAENKQPGKVYDFRLKSRESEAVKITVRFF